MAQHRRLALLTSLVALAACGDPIAPAPAGDAGPMIDPPADAGAGDDAQVDPDGGAPIATRPLVLRSAGWGVGALVVAGHAPCEGECTLAIPEGATVTIEARPGYGQHAVSWGDDCAPTAADASCTLTLDADRVASVEWAGGGAVAAASIGGSGSQTIVDVEIASDGDLVVVVNTSGPLTLPDGEARVTYGGHDCFVARLSSDAALVRWVARTRGGGTEQCAAARIMEDDDVIVAGTAFGAFSLGGHAFAAADSDAFVARIAAGGDVVWAERMPTLAAGADQATDVLLHVDGHVYVAAGIAAGAGQGARAGYYIVDAATGAATVRSLGGTGGGFANAIAPAPDGDLYLAGNFAYTLGAPAFLTAAAGVDGFVMRISTDGAVAWAQRAGGAGTEDNLYDVAADEAGNVYVVGVFNGTITLPGQVAAVPPAGGFDWLVSAFDATGTPLWSRSGGGSGDDFPSRIVYGGNGELYVAGTWEGTAANPATTETALGGSDAYVVRLDAAGTDARFVRLVQSDGRAAIAGIVVRADRMIAFGWFGGTSRLGMPEGAPAVTAAGADGFLYFGGS